MPSVNSSSMPMVGASSTVMTPSLPTLSNASAMTSPIFASCAEIVATWATSLRSSTSRADLSSISATAAEAASMPRLSEIGLAPAATLRSPSWTMAWASTVAVVVPSPATSLVLVATSLASCAPRFSVGSSSSISRATVTPSLVIVGAPHFLSITTLRPFGPSVTLTASARWFTPRSRARRASSSNTRLLAIWYPSVFLCRFCPADVGKPWLSRHRPGPGRGSPELPPRAASRAGAVPGRQVPARRGPGPRAKIRSLLLDNGEYVTGREHQVLLAVVLHFGAAVLAVQHDVADADVQRDALDAGVVVTAGTDSQDLALLGLLLGSVGDHQARCGGLLSLERAHHDPVFERLQNNLGGGRHDLTSPFGKG